MSDYKRLVSYLYYYEQNNKKDNIGYVRAETRNGQCKIAVYAKMPRVMAEFIRVYIFRRGKERPNYYLLGEFPIKHSIMEARIIVNPDSIMNSGYSIDNMGGVVLYLSPNHFYGTEWDDIPIEMYDLDLETEKMQKVKELQKPSQQEAQQRKETQQQQAQQIRESQVQNQQQAQQIRESQVQNQQQAQQIRESQVQRELEKSRQLQDQKKEELEKPNKTEEIQGLELQGNNIIEQSDFDLISKTVSLGTLEQSIDYAMQQEREQSNDNIEPNQAKEQAEEDCIVNRIFKKYSKIQLGKGMKSIYAVKLEPQDIGLLPMEMWVLGNNSFLLHGYYNYRHLAFIRRSKEKQTEYLLGIPGTMNHQEHLLARMFGFFEFLPVTSEENPQNGFGYWYTKVIFPP